MSLHRTPDPSGAPAIEGQSPSRPDHSAKPRSPRQPARPAPPVPPVRPIDLPAPPHDGDGAALPDPDAPFSARAAVRAAIEAGHARPLTGVPWIKERYGVEITRQHFSSVTYNDRHRDGKDAKPAKAASPATAKPARPRKEGAVATLPASLPPDEAPGVPVAASVDPEPLPALESAPAPQWASGEAPGDGVDRPATPATPAPPAPSPLDVVTRPAPSVAELLRAVKLVKGLVRSIGPEAVIEIARDAAAEE